MTGTTELTAWDGVASGTGEGVGTLAAVGSGGCCTVEDGGGSVSVEGVLDAEIVGSRAGEEGEEMVFDC